MGICSKFIDSVFFSMTASEQQRRVLVQHTPAKRLALGCVYVTYSVTLMTFPPGRNFQRNKSKMSKSHFYSKGSSFFFFKLLFRFKNLVHHYQSMYPSLTVDVDDQLKKLKVGVGFCCLIRHKPCKSIYISS